MEKITCTNEECRYQFEKPIAIFDGSLICPKCASVISVKKFEVTRYNNDLFEKAEMYYGKYLSLSTKRNISRTEMKKMEDLLEGAIMHCREASLSGHPGARVLLGRFWQSGYMDRNDNTRYKMAFHYFNNVCTIDDFSMERGQQVIGSYTEDFRTPNASFRETQCDAARHLLHLLAIAKNNLKGEAYKFEDKAAELIQRSLISSAEANVIKGKSIAKKETVNYKKAVRAAYESTKAKKHCPIFAYFIIPLRDFSSLWESTLVELNSGKHKYLSSVTTCYAPLKKKDKVGGLEVGELSFVMNDLDGAPRLGSADAVLLYFYNPKPTIPKSISGFLTKRLPYIARLLYPDGEGMDTARTYLNSFLDANPYDDHVICAEDLFFALKNADHDDIAGSALNVLKEHL